MIICGLLRLYPYNYAYESSDMASKNTVAYIIKGEFGWFSYDMWHRENQICFSCARGFGNLNQ